jgi:hypothetical protein
VPFLQDLQFDGSEQRSGVVGRRRIGATLVQSLLKFLQLGCYVRRNNALKKMHCSYETNTHLDPSVRAARWLTEPQT